MLCALTSFGAFAQESVVKDVDHLIGGMTPDFKTACEKIAPALTNAESKDDAKTWFVAGKANAGFYDQQYTQMQLKQQVDTAAMANALIKAYDYFTTALPLDSVKQLNKDGSPKLNKDGSVKVKTKYSKEIVDILITRHNDFSMAGNLLYNMRKYPEAAKCWGIYAKLPYSGIAPREKFLAPDTTVAEIEFYQGIALWQGEDLKGAVEAFASARKHGYTKKEAYDYAMSCYAGLNDNAGIVAVAKEALPLYGDTDVQYLNILINDNINNGKYDEAKTMLDAAIAKNPNSAELQNLLGLIYEQQKDEAKALELFKKAVELNPEYAQGQFNYGRCLMKKAVEVQQELESLKGAAYQTARNEKLVPLFKEILPYMEKAYELDSTNSNAKNILRNLYYQLGDEAKLNALEGK